MQAPPHGNLAALAGGSSRRAATVEVALIFLIFFMAGAWPVPDVNESHYLTKARHYWDPQWCANDFFLNTADAHLAFYWTFGWLTKLMPLPAVAWCGRLLTWGLLAWAWQRLSAAIVDRPFYAVFTAALFVTLNERCQMAGEWMIGGVEAKGFAYVLVLLALEAIVRGRWSWAIVLLGGATGLHAVIGGWSSVAAAVAWLTSRERPRFEQLALPLVAWVVLAAAGIVPALALTWGIDSTTVREANRIYVYERLNHHLLPQAFPTAQVWRHLLLVAALVALAYFAPRDARLGRLRAFVATSVGLAAIGMLIGMWAPVEPDLAASLLRYYWFRLSDVMVPLGAVLLAAALVVRWQALGSRSYVVAAVAVLMVAGVHFGRTLEARHDDPRPRADVAVENVAAWRKVCEWIARETPADACFLVPRLDQTFRWYAGRAEVVSRKDLPQDAAAIVEWWQRMQTVYGAEPGSTFPWASRWPGWVRGDCKNWAVNMALVRHYDDLSCRESSSHRPGKSEFRDLSSERARRGTMTPRLEGAIQRLASRIEWTCPSPRDICCTSAPTTRPRRSTFRERRRDVATIVSAEAAIQTTRGQSSAICKPCRLSLDQPSELVGQLIANPAVGVKSRATLGANPFAGRRGGGLLCQSTHRQSGAAVAAGLLTKARREKRDRHEHEADGQDDGPHHDNFHRQSPRQFGYATLETTPGRLLPLGGADRGLKVSYHRCRMI